MMKAGIDQNALIDMFTSATAQQTEQLRKAVGDATLQALQGRELTLKNIRNVIATVTQAANTAAVKGATGGVDVGEMLDSAVAGMDDALLKAVDANRVALQQLLSQGADLREKHLKKALSDLDKFEDTLVATVQKAAGGAGDQVAAQWAPVLEKLNAGGTASGAKAAKTAEQFATQMHTAMREGRAASLKAAQALAESYGALVSGVLIGMSDALRQGGAKPAAKKR